MQTLEPTHDGVSVLMPVRNGRSTVGLAVKSTLLALPRNGRMLIADDGSTDGTMDVLAQFTDPRLTVCRNDVSQGVATTLNRLLRLAATRHVSRMDADDITLPNRFARQRRHLGGNCDLTFSTVINFGDSPRGFKPAIPIGISPAAMPFFLLVGNPLGHSAMYGSTRTMLGTSGYVPGPAEDYELWMRLAAAGHRLRRTAAPLIAYRHHASQTIKEADWRTRVLNDPNLQSSHRRLALSVGWEGPDFFDIVTRGAQSPGDGAVLDQLEKFFSVRCTALSAVEQRHLRHQLHKLTR
ncbi:MAG: hypothetical protein JWQ75_2019 [Pseudarthrobacter sp.]|nr:hypothetical protein [Pseudarthrobacter sp.]